jgi:hypothetical protein
VALIEKSPWERFRDWISQRLKSAPSVVSRLFAHPERDVVWKQDGPESGVWAEIVRRSDGLYSFAEWKRQRLSTPGLDDWEAEFPVFESGLYDSEDQARQAMADHIGWLMR